MKRTDIKVNNEFIIKFCHSFHRRQKEVLQAKINDGKMSAYQANQNYITIIQYKELAELLESKKMEWKDLIKMVRESEVKKQPRQVKIHFPT